tara:strand:- start:237918 stop:238655 length:738 start_codon:yes stop_codon:yes gene_type:complete
MIVRKTNEGWDIIYQYAHGILAGQIAHHLKHKFRPEFWVETLTAIIEHDDNQLDFNEKPYLNDAGMPQDFNEVNRSEDENLERAERVFDTAMRKSGFVALLISLHLEFLYGDLEKTHNGFKKMLRKQKKIRKELRTNYSLSKKEAAAYYEILRFCDRCSLILCQEKLPAVERMLEINTSIEGEQYFIFCRSDGSIGVEPWCFESEKFEVGVELHPVTESTFKSNKELKKALDTAAFKRETFSFRK